MKIRTAFVSNSSSASFVLILFDTTKEEFLKILEEENYIFRMKSILESRYLSNINSLGYIKNLKYEDPNELNIFETFQLNRETEYRREQELLNHYESFPTEKLIKTFIDLYGIQMTIKEDNIILNSFVSMFNSLESDLTEMFIILERAFNNRNKLYHLEVIE